MGFFSGAGMWIAIQHGGLQGLSREVLEAAELDGCNAWQKALYIKLPFMRPYIVYQTILIFALNVQLFVEPQLLDFHLGPGQRAAPVGPKSARLLVRV
jgi:multiple sugar transport system permease protein